MALHVWHCASFELPLPPAHRFPMAKYRLLYERVRDAAQALGVTLREPERASDQILHRAHCPDYVERVQSGGLSAAEQRRIGFPWTPAMAERSRRVAAASCAALLRSLDDGVAMTLAGGTHHARRERGGGYCIYNDSVLALRNAQALGKIKRGLVIDLDVHHGDGTAALTRDDPSIYTFDVYAARNYPAIKEAVSLAVPLPDGTDDATYLQALRTHLPQAIAAARADAVVYLAGADPYAGDRLGYLNLSKAGLRQRDELVLEHCRAAGLPVTISMAGGYAESVGDIVDIHFGTVQAAALSVRLKGPSWSANLQGPRAQKSRVGGLLAPDE